MQRPRGAREGEKHKSPRSGQVLRLERKISDVPGAGPNANSCPGHPSGREETGSSEP